MCTNPIWIKNRRYYDSNGRLVSRDLALSNLAANPYDMYRTRLCVPCGECPDCLRRIRNDWFVRLDRELTRCRVEHTQAVFITITIAPKHYEKAIRNPSAFIRAWFERVRHICGRTIKHALFQEFGEHPEMGGEPRLHFHGFLFDFPYSYNTLRAAVSDFGFIWLGKPLARRARYVVKYVVKDVSAFEPIIRPGVDPRIFRRKFISPGVGDYLGRRPRPSASVDSWAYLDFKTGIRYNYSIPRYYDRYLGEVDKAIRSWRSGLTYCTLAGDNDLASRIVRNLIPEVQKGVLHSGRHRTYSEINCLRSRFGLDKCRVNPIESFVSLLGDEKSYFDLLSFWRSSFVSLNFLSYG